MKPDPDTLPELPEGYVALEVLSRREGSLVLKVLRGGGEAVMRLALDGSREVAAELNVLASCRHPALTDLLDFGSLPGSSGGTYLARAFVPGSNLRPWARGREVADVARAFFRVCGGLAALHVAGFVHNDVKAANVVVDPNGDAVLCDHGLSLAVGFVARISGTPGAIAPEVLLGLPPSPRSDLFSFGVMMYEVLGGTLPSARDFYGRFPADDFWAAVGSDISAVPAPFRALVAALVERDPDRRPRSAADVARALAGITGERVELDVQAPGVPADLGCQDTLTEVVERVERQPAARYVRLMLPEGEAPTPIAQRLQLLLGLRGLPAERVDLEAAHRSARNTQDLAQWAHEQVEGRHDRVLLVEVEGPGPAAALRALEAALQAGAGARALVVLAIDGPDDIVEEGVEVVRVQPLDEVGLVGFLASVMPSENGERRSELAHALGSAAEGRRSRLESLLADGLESGWLLPAADGFRSRPGALPASFGSSRGRKRGSLNNADEARTVAAWSWLGDGASLESLAAVSGLKPNELEVAVGGLSSSGCLERRRNGSFGPRAATPLGLEEWLLADGLAELHERCAQWLRANGADEHSVLPHEVGASGAAELQQRVMRTAGELRDVGRPELALDLLERCSAFATEGAPAEWVAEKCAAWCALGLTQRAERELAKLERGALRDALEARVLGLVATREQRYEDALDCLDRAAAADDRWKGEAAVARANFLYYSGCDGPLADWWGELEQRVDEEFSVREAEQVRSVIVMSRLRCGEVQAARTLLHAQLDRAYAGADELRAGAVLVNLSITERRAGRLGAARDHALGAVEIYDRFGALAGLAQASSILAAALRELGLLLEAQSRLEGAIDQYERLGDPSGGTLARAALALLRADRGHVGAAIEELARAASMLAGPQRVGFIPILECRRSEAQARCGLSSFDATPSADPRTHVWLGRARAYGGDLDAARSSWRDAVEAARSLHQQGVLAEASFQLAISLHSEIPADECEKLALASPRVAMDLRVLGLLAVADLRSRKEEAAALASELEANGRDDRAARLWIALAVRCDDDVARARAEAAFARCAAGLDPPAAEVLRRHLLEFPDPYSDDLDAPERTLDDLEADVLALLDISRKLVEQVDLKSLLGTIVEHALDLTGAERGFLMLREHGKLRFDTALDSRRGAIEEPELEISRSVVSEAIDRGCSLRISDASEDPMLGSAASVSSLDLRSVLCSPFDVERGLHGALYVDHRHRRGAFTERAQRLLELLSDQAALAIRQVRRFEEIGALNERLNQRVAERETDLFEARRALERAGVQGPVGGLVGRSDAMARVQHDLERAAATSLPVVVTGASGTGKELAARALHELGPRKSGPFVVENCAAIAESLFESELFGHRRGAFTGADRDKAGLFERAEGGTLFLDEVAEMPLPQQAKLLRVLESSEVRRVGDDRLRSVDFRLVVATNRDLDVEVREERFRADLYYRLNAVRIELPSLADRPEDIPALVEHFLRLESAGSGITREVSRPVLAALCRRAWPGNVRELRNEIARLCALSAGDLDEPELVREADAGIERSKRGEIVPMRDLEREAILSALAATGDDKNEAARRLGISRAKIYQRLREWDEGRRE